mgnify:FL=1
MGNAMAVLLLKGVFGDHGIPYIEKNEQVSGVLAGFAGGTASTIKVMVPMEFEEAALTLVADFRSQLESA